MIWKTVHRYHWKNPSNASNRLQEQSLLSDSRTKSWNDVCSCTRAKWFPRILGKSQEFSRNAGNSWESFRKLPGIPKNFQWFLKQIFTPSRTSREFQRILENNVSFNLTRLFKYNSWKFSRILGNYILLANKCPIHVLCSVSMLLTRHSRLGLIRSSHRALYELIASSTFTCKMLSCFWTNYTSKHSYWNDLSSCFWHKIRT